MYSAAICMFSCIFLIISLFCVRSTKKWFKKQLKILEKKKKELDELLYSATDMVHELNNVSDYVVTTVNEKNIELKDVIANVDEKSIELRAVMTEIDEKIEECRLLFEGKGKIVELHQEINLDRKSISKREAINNLFDKGNDVSDIAKELGLGKGEVQLILGMKARIHERNNVNLA